MSDDFVDLEQVRIRYNSATGSVELYSSDPRFEELPFGLSLPKGSPGASELLQLLRGQGLVAEEELLPERITVDDLDGWSSGLDEHDIAGVPRPRPRDSRLLFPLGETYGAKPVSIDLGFAAHSLITGAQSTGKTELLIALAQHASERAIDLRLLDPSGEGIARRMHRIYRKDSAQGPKECSQLLNSLGKELTGRLKTLAQSGYESSVAYEAERGPMAPLVVFVDALDSFDSVGWLKGILQSGEKVGIYLFATTRSSFSIGALEDESVLLNFERRVLMGEQPGQERIAGRGSLQTLGAKPTAMQFIRGR